MDRTKRRKLAFIWLAVALTWVSGCIHCFIYHPSAKIVSTPAGIGLPFEPVGFFAEDGVRLWGWWIPAEAERGVVLFFHGSGGNISHELDILMILNRLGMSVFMFDYRGFGLSEGETTESGTRLDAEAAWSYLVHTRQIAGERIVLFGRSLGGAVAAGLARKRLGRALILESTFTSLREIAEDFVPCLPVFPIPEGLYNTRLCLRDYPNRVLVIHSSDDEIVPFKHGMLLYRTAPGPKQFLEIRGSHFRGALDSLEAYEEGIGAFLTTVFTETAPCTATSDTKIN